MSEAKIAPKTPRRKGRNRPHDELADKGHAQGGQTAADGFYVFITYDGSIWGHELKEKGPGFWPICKTETEECAKAIAENLAQRAESDTSFAVSPVNNWPMPKRLQFDVDLQEPINGPPSITPEGLDIPEVIIWTLTRHAWRLHEAYKAARRPSEEAELPNDLIPTPVAVKDYGVSRTTLRRAVKDGRLRDYRPEGHKENAPYFVSRAEIASLYPRR